MRLPVFALRPRTLLVAMAVILAITALAVWYAVATFRNPGRVELADLPRETTATVGLAGMLPGEESDPLANPLGIAWDGNALYIAESDAGRIRVVDSAGGEIGIVGLSPAKGRNDAYPSSVAVTDDDRLVVVDNAAPRVIVVSAEPAERAKVLLTLGNADAPGQPTSVAYASGEFYVFDAEVGAVHVYAADGELARTIGADLEPKLAFATGMTVVDGKLYAADANAGRVVVLDASTGEQLLVFPDRYTLPRAVVSLEDGRLAVIDTFDRSVHITDADGVRADIIDEATVPEGSMASPRAAVWVPEEQRLYVADAAAGVVAVFNVRLRP